MKKRNIGCVVMASGLGKRFGSNKLIAEFAGKTMLEWVLDVTGENLFEDRIVVTRHSEVVEICEKRNVKVFLHHLPMRSDTIRMGLKQLAGDIQGCMFCQADQPLLKRESLEKMVEIFAGTGDICRLGCKGCAGSPVLFGRDYFEELNNLPEGKGGNVIIQKYADRVKLVETQNPWELEDVDTPETRIRLESVLEQLDG